MQPSESPDYDEIDIILGRIRRKTVLEMIEALKKVPCVVEVKEV
jgi:hypothetical protein